MFGSLQYNIKDEDAFDIYPALNENGAGIAFLITSIIYFIPWVISVVSPTLWGMIKRKATQLYIVGDILLSGSDFSLFEGRISRPPLLIQFLYMLFWILVLSTKFVYDYYFIATPLAENTDEVSLMMKRASAVVRRKLSILCLSFIFFFFSCFILELPEAM